jgi:translocation and assembly module TamB
LLLVDAPNQPTTASGQLDLVDGEYSYYGQTLTIKSGSRLIYAGNAIDNPTLNLQAVREVMAVASGGGQTGIISTTPTSAMANTALMNQPVKVTVGVDVRGAARHPRLQLFAAPAVLNQTDILAYLLTGQGGAQLGGASLGLLFNAANSLNPGQSTLQRVLNNLQKTAGLTQISIQSTSVMDPATNTLLQGTSLVLSKTLTPKLYINYSVGLLQPIQVLQVNYLLNKYLTLQSSSNNFANGIDLLYAIERE